MPLCCTSGNCVDLTEREFAVCRSICASSQPVSFSELKLQSSLHQEILSRILRRLTIYRVIQKVGEGKYERSPKNDLSSQSKKHMLPDKL